MRERLAVALRALPDHSVGDQIGDHRPPPPLLALVHVGKVYLNDRLPERLERVVNRVAVVRPRTWIDDQRVGVVVGVVDPLDELALAVRLTAANAHPELLSPFVDPCLELVQADPAVQRVIASADDVEVDSVQDEDLHGGSVFELTEPDFSLAARSVVRARAAPHPPAVPRLRGPR